MDHLSTSNSPPHSHKSSFIIESAAIIDSWLRKKTNSLHNFNSMLHIFFPPVISLAVDLFFCHFAINYTLHASIVMSDCPSRTLLFPKIKKINLNWRDFHASFVKHFCQLFTHHYKKNYEGNWRKRKERATVTRETMKRFYNVSRAEIYGSAGLIYYFDVVSCSFYAL